MSELITTSEAPLLPATMPKDVALSVNLSRLVEDVANPHPDLRTAVTLPKFLRQEAEAAYQRYSQLSECDDKQRVFHWLLGVNMGLGNPLGQRDFAIRSVEIIDALANLPNVAFNASTRREAQIAFRFFPGVSELYALLWPHVRHIASRRDALRRLLASQAEEQSERDALSDEDRQRILEDFRQKFAAAVAPARQAERPDDRRPTPHYLSPAQLRMAYEAQARSDNNLVAGIAHGRLNALGTMPTATAVDEPVEQEASPW